MTLNDIKDKLDFFCKMYDTARLVDPERKKVLEYRASSLAGTQETCHAYWGNGKICDNCVSIRAYQGNRSFIKLEKSKDEVFLVTAIPIENAGRPAVLELLKDTTGTLLVGSGDYNEGEVFRRYAQEISDMIVKDPLTSLYNRRFVNERLPADVVNAALKGFPLSVCFLDLDDFKSINDLYGHGAGDSAIRAAGHTIMDNLRSGHDWAARYGGDEFLLCFNRTGKEQAAAIAERIRDEIEKIPVDFSSGTVRLSISFGLKAMEASPMMAEELIRGADQDMYRAKRAKQSARGQKPC